MSQRSCRLIPHFALPWKLKRSSVRKSFFTVFLIKDLFWKMKFIFYPSSCTFLSPFRIHLQRTILPGALYAYPAFSFWSDDPTPLFLHHRLRSSDEKGHLQRLRHRCFRRFENSGKNHANVNRSDDRRGDPACLRLPGCPRIPPRKPSETHRLPL